MGSIFKKAFTKPLPTGAETFERQGKKFARWKDATGKTRTAALAYAKDGTVRISVKTSVYYARYRDAEQIVHEASTGCKDETAARQVLSDLERQVDRVRAGVVTTKEVRVASSRATPIDEHVEAFLVSREARGCTAKHIRESKRILKAIFDGCEFRTLADLDRSRLEVWLNARKDAGASARTRNTDLTTIITFANWCSDPNVGRLASNPFLRMTKANAKADPRRRRRAMTEKELIRLLAVARERPLAEALTVRRGKNKGQAVAKIRPEIRQELERLGVERSILYKTLILTGLRKGELASLTVAKVKLDDPEPHVELDAADEKSREGNQIPLRADLVADLRAWLIGKHVKAVEQAKASGQAVPDRLPPGTPVFNVPTGLLRIFDRDLAAAGIVKRDDRGRTLDVHALRTTFGTLLSVGGVSLRTAQKAMRHKDPILTANVYTDAKHLDVMQALDSLPSLPLGTSVEARPKEVKKPVRG
jgi:integrase